MNRSQQILTLSIYRLASASSAVQPQMFVWKLCSKTNRDFCKIQPCTGLALGSCYINTRIPGKQAPFAKYLSPEKCGNAFDHQHQRNKELNRCSKNKICKTNLNPIKYLSIHNTTIIILAKLVMKTSQCSCQSHLYLKVFLVYENSVYFISCIQTYKSAIKLTWQHSSKYQMAIYTTYMNQV